ILVTSLPIAHLTMAARIQVTMRMTIASPTLVRTDHRSWLCMSLLSFGYSELTRRFFALLIGSLFSADIQNKGFAIAAEFPKPQLSRNRGVVGIRIFQGANRKLIYPSQSRIKAVPRVFGDRSAPRHRGNSAGGARSCHPVDLRIPAAGCRGGGCRRRWPRRAGAPIPGSRPGRAAGPARRRG